MRDQSGGKLTQAYHRRSEPSQWCHLHTGSRAVESSTQICLDVLRRTCSCILRLGTVREPHNRRSGQSLHELVSDSSNLYDSDLLPPPKTMWEWSAMAPGSTRGSMRAIPVSERQGIRQKAAALPAKAKVATVVEKDFIAANVGDRAPAR
jgi:hypothetical protein